jgi:hypothetical protein
MGHDSERAAMIYQHEGRGADQRITEAIDSHVLAECAWDDGLARSANGPRQVSGVGASMARTGFRLLT